MSSNSIVSGMLNQEITAISTTSRDGYGRVTKTQLYTDIPCRWQEMFQIILDKAGLETVAKIQSWIPDEYEGEVLDVESDFVVTFNGADYVVITTENRYNILGEREYIKLYLR